MKRVGTRLISDVIRRVTYGGGRRGELSTVYDGTINTRMKNEQNFIPSGVLASSSTELIPPTHGDPEMGFQIQLTKMFLLCFV